MRQKIFTALPIPAEWLGAYDFAISEPQKRQYHSCFGAARGELFLLDGRSGWDGVLIKLVKPVHKGEHFGDNLIEFHRDDLIEFKPRE
jgi:hypothetical protein